MCYLTDHNAVKFVKKIFGDEDVEAVLQRLDRLTLDEARTTAAQTLEVIHGLVQGMRVLMNGEQTHSACKSVIRRISFYLEGKASVNIVREALGTFFFGDDKLVLRLTEL
jgi:hypothetical protein